MTGFSISLNYLRKKLKFFFRRMTKNTFIKNRYNEKLETTVRMPEGKNKLPAVIMVAGIGANLHETNNSHDEISERLVNAGFITIQFSFAGRGNSEGDYNHMTLERQGFQVEDVISWVQNYLPVDQNRIGIYAMSFGVPSTLSSTLNSVTSLCLVSGGYFPRQAMERMFRQKGEYDPQGISWRKFSTGEILNVKSDFWASLDRFNQLEVAKKLVSPTLIIHGDCDPKIPVADVKKVFSAVGSKNKKLKIFPGGDHGILEVPKEMREEFLKVVTNWFKETL
jgi:hypothetical protein